MKLFFIVCSFFFAINMMAQEPMQEVVGLETKSVSQIPGVILKFFHEVQSSGHIEFVARVLDENNQSMEPQGAYTYSWSITGSPVSTTAYIWPRAAGQGSIADVSVYYTTSGRAEVACEVYKNGSYKGTLYGYVYF